MAGVCKPASQSSTAGVRAAIGSSELMSLFAFGSVPQRVVQTAPATVSFGKLMSQQQHSTMLGWSSTAGVRAAVGSSELTSLFAFGSVPQRVVQTAPAMVSFGKLTSHKKPLG